MTGYNEYRDRIKDPYARLLPRKQKKNLRKKNKNLAREYKPSRVLTKEQQERLDKKTNEWMKNFKPNIDPGEVKPLKKDKVKKLLDRYEYLSYKKRW